MKVGSVWVLGVVLVAFSVSANAEEEEIRVGGSPELAALIYEKVLHAKAPIAVAFQAFESKLTEAGLEKVKRTQEFPQDEEFRPRIKVGPKSRTIELVMEYRGRWIGSGVGYFQWVRAVIKGEINGDPARVLETKRVGLVLNSLEFKDTIPKFEEL